MQEVTSLTQILPLVAAGASVFLALGAAAFLGIFFFMSTRLHARAEEATGQVESSTKRLSQMYERMYRDSLARNSLAKKQPGGQVEPPLEEIPLSAPLQRGI